jgi:alanine dehydrogenase
MKKIALIKEGKIPPDNRVALTPAQCKWVHKNFDSVEVIVQSSSARCFSDREFLMAGVEVKEDISDCDIFLGIKEVPVQELIPQNLLILLPCEKQEIKVLQTILDDKITLIDYECLEHEDGHRIIGFGLPVWWGLIMA